MQNWIIDIMNQFGYIGVALLIAIENIFPPIPSEVILTFGGFMTTYTNLSIWGVVIAATIGSLIGAIVLYGIGRFLSPERLGSMLDGKIGRILHFKKQNVFKACNWFKDKGRSTVLFCRCIPVLRSLISIPAGMSRMKLGIFLLLTGIGSLIWNIILVYLGAMAETSWETIVAGTDVYTKVTLIVFGVILVLVALLFIKKKSKNKGYAQSLVETTDENRSIITRIFNEYCTFTPFQYAERIRLLKCVEYIQKGNTLKTAAIQFGYSPEVLSNAIKVNLDLSVEKIRKEDFALKKDIMISSMWKRLGEFKLQYNQDKFFPLMDSLHNEKVLKCIHADSLSDENATCDWFDIVLDYKKVKKILYEVDGCLIDKKVYEDFSVSDNAILHLIMQKDQDDGVSFRNDELLKYYFIVGFFYNTESPDLVDGKYIFRLNDGIKEILASLAEIKEDTNEIYDMTLHATMKNNSITLELGTAYKEALLVWKNMN